MNRNEGGGRERDRVCANERDGQTGMVIGTLVVCTRPVDSVDPGQR